MLRKFRQRPHQNLLRYTIDYSSRVNITVFALTRILKNEAKQNCSSICIENLRRAENCQFKVACKISIDFIYKIFDQNFYLTFVNWNQTLVLPK